jgi:hypothetical protein
MLMHSMAVREDGAPKIPLFGGPEPSAACGTEAKRRLWDWSQAPPVADEAQS